MKDEEKRKERRGRRGKKSLRGNRNVVAATGLLQVWLEFGSNFFSWELLWLGGRWLFGLEASDFWRMFTPALSKKREREREEREVFAREASK